jgi:hypothetical protein
MHYLEQDSATGEVRAEAGKGAGGSGRPGAGAATEAQQQSAAQVSFLTAALMGVALCFHSVLEVFTPHLSVDTLQEVAQMMELHALPYVRYFCRTDRDGGAQWPAVLGDETFRNCLLVKTCQMCLLMQRQASNMQRFTKVDEAEIALNRQCRHSISSAVGVARADQWLPGVCMQGMAMGAQANIVDSVHIFIAIAAHKGLAAYALGSSVVDSQASSPSFLFSAWVSNEQQMACRFTDWQGSSSSWLSHCRQACRSFGQ